MTLTPGTCLVTGKHDGPAVDLGVELFPETGPEAWRLYISESAVLAAAALFGGIGPEQAAAYEERIAELEADVERWRRLAVEREELEAHVVAAAERRGVDLEPKAEPARKAAKKAAPRKDAA